MFPSSAPQNPTPILTDSKFVLFSTLYEPTSNRTNISNFPHWGRITGLNQLMFQLSAIQTTIYTSPDSKFVQSRILIKHNIYLKNILFFLSQTVEWKTLFVFPLFNIHVHLRRSHTDLTIEKILFDSGPLSSSSTTLPSGFTSGRVIQYCSVSLHCCFRRFHILMLT